MATQSTPVPVAADKTSVNITLPKHVFDWFKQQAEEDTRSLNNHLAVILTKLHRQHTTPAGGN